MSCLIWNKANASLTLEAPPNFLVNLKSNVVLELRGACEERLPYAEHGFIKAVVGLISGLVLSFIVSSILSNLLGETGKTMAVMVNVLSIIIGLIQLERAKYWSLSYIFGYFSGLFLFGRYFMEDWELLLYLIVIGVYMIQKMMRKVGM